MVLRSLEPASWLNSSSASHGLQIVGKFLTLFIPYFPKLQHREDTSGLYKILTKVSGMWRAPYKCLLEGYYPHFIDV